MVGNIIVAVLCNLVAAMIVVSGIFSGIKNGWKVSLVKLFLTVGSFFGAYFLTPVLISKLLGIAVDKVTLGSLIVPRYLTTGSINSIIFLLVFVAFYALTLFICHIVRACLINKLKDKQENKIKMIRAKSINPKAERMARRAAKKQLVSDYNQVKNRFLSKFFGCIIGLVIAAAVSLITLMPYGYIVKLINKDGKKPYLEKGYEYTLNGIIPEKVFDWTIHNKNDVIKEDTVVTPQPEDPEVETPEEIPVETPEVTE